VKQEMPVNNRMRPMALIALSLLCCLAAPASAAERTPTWPDAIKARNAEMKRRVDAWLKDAKPTPMPVHVVYLSCKDQEPFPGHRDRLNRVLTEVQDWMKAQHEAAGFGPVTMHLERDDTG